MRYGYPANNTNLYPVIILILIVLQWMRTPANDPNNLVNNGGLFIIALFSLIFCQCVSMGHLYHRRSWYY